jgi:hypothetical protein
VAAGEHAAPQLFVLGIDVEFAVQTRAPPANGLSIRDNRPPSGPDESGPRITVFMPPFLGSLERRCQRPDSSARNPCTGVDSRMVHLGAVCPLNGANWRYEIMMATPSWMMSLDNHGGI